MDNKLYPQYNFRFSGLKETYDNYYLTKNEKGELVVIEKSTNGIIIDPLIVDRMKFALSWMEATKKSHSRITTESGTTDQDYNYAFNEGAQLTYATMMACIQKQLLTTGNIDFNEIIDSEEQVNYKYAKEYVTNLFSEERFVNALDKWSRYAIPNALPATKPLETLGEKKSEFGL